MKRAKLKKGYATGQQLADVLGVKRLTLYRWMREGLMPLAKEGKVDRGELRKLLLPKLPEEKFEAPAPAGFVDVPTAAGQLGVTTATLYMAITAGKLKAQLFEGKKYLTTGEVERYDAARKMAKEARALRLRIAQLTKQHARLTQLAEKNGDASAIH